MAGLLRGTCVNLDTPLTFRASIGSSTDGPKGRARVRYPLRYRHVNSHVAGPLHGAPVPKSHVPCDPHACRWLGSSLGSVCV
eukprot:1191752-Pyramimonas_sp.AAC.1